MQVVQPAVASQGCLYGGWTCSLSTCWGKTMLE